MFELPLFPLNTVLFPGQPMALHIFEERYKEMIGLCVETHQPFGIVLLETGNAEMNPFSANPSVPYAVGSTAQITQVKHLTEGRMNITVVGRERFKIHALQHNKPYLVGQVEMFPLEVSSSQRTANGAQALNAWVTRYLDVLQNAEQIQPGPRVLPSDPTTLAYLASVLLAGISMEQKQALLTAATLDSLLDDLRDIYRREVVLLETLLSPPEDSLEGPFSLN